MKRILVVCSQSPYPTHHGGAFDVFERIKGLKSLNYQIDLVITTKFEIEPLDYQVMESFINNIFVVERKNKWRDLFSFYPLQYNSRKKLLDIKFDIVYDYVILESEFLGSILKNTSLKYRKLIVRVHNNEAYYFKQLAKSTNNWFKKIYYLTDSFKLSRLTDYVLKVTDRIWYISQKEYEESNFKSKSIFLPPPINSEFLKQSLDNQTVLFIGSLFMANNTQGLDWFLENIHPRLISQYPTYKFIIAGSSGDVNKAYLEKKYGQLSRVQFLMNQVQLEEVYNKATVFINPMFFGSGVKLKSINALVNGLLLVSTKVGTEGIGLTKNKMYLEGEDINEFLGQIKIIFKMPLEEKQTIIQQAQDYLKEIHYLKIIKNELENFD